MAKTFNKDKIVQKQICKKCNQIIKPIKLYMEGKPKSAKECGCGLFVNGKKIEI